MKVGLASCVWLLGGGVNAAIAMPGSHVYTVYNSTHTTLQVVIGTILSGTFLIPGYRSLPTKVRRGRCDRGVCGYAWLCVGLRGFV